MRFVFSSCSGVKSGDQINSKNVWNVVSEKLLDSLNATAHGGSLGDRGLATEQYRLKQPLSLDALADGPRFRLFWACFQRLLNEAGTVFMSPTTLIMFCLLVPI